MAKRFTDTEKFSKPFMRGMAAKYKLFWLYILDNCDNAGVWEAELDVAEIRLGVSLSTDEALHCFGSKILLLDNGSKWFIPTFILFQYGPVLNISNNAHKGVIKKLNARGISDLEGNYIEPYTQLFSKHHKPGTIPSLTTAIEEKEDTEEKDDLLEYDPAPTFESLVLAYLIKVEEYYLPAGERKDIQQIGVKIAQRLLDKDQIPTVEAKVDTFKSIIQNLDSWTRSNKFNMHYINTNFATIVKGIIERSKTPTKSNNGALAKMINN